MPSTSPELADYADSVGAAEQDFASMDPAQLRDPDNAAAAIIEVVASPHLPLRLTLGDDAVDGIAKKLTDQLAVGPAWGSAGRRMR